MASTRTTPYHPQGDGQVERMNRTLLGMLRSLEERQKSSWSDHVNKVLFAYNCTRHESTSYSPFFLLFGRSPKLPIDTLFGLGKDTGSDSYTTYVKNWQNAMQDAHEIAKNNSELAGQKSKSRYDRKVTGRPLSISDRVLVRNLSERGGPGKLRSFWEDKVHIVVSRKGDPDYSPVYGVKPEYGPGRERVLHRNLLLPCPELDLDSEPPNSPVSDSKHDKSDTKRQNCKKVSESHNTSRQVPDYTDSDTDSEDEHLDFVASYLSNQGGRSMRENDSQNDSKSSMRENDSQNDSNLQNDSNSQNDLQHDFDQFHDNSVNQSYSEDNQGHDSSAALSSGESRHDSEHRTELSPEASEFRPRSTRIRKKPKTVNYDVLGNPSVYVVNAPGFMPYSVMSVQGNFGIQPQQPVLWWQMCRPPDIGIPQY